MADAIQHYSTQFCITVVGFTPNFRSHSSGAIRLTLTKISKHDQLLGEMAICTTTYFANVPNISAVVCAQGN